MHLFAGPRICSNTRMFQTCHKSVGGMPTINTFASTVLSALWSHSPGLGRRPMSVWCCIHIARIAKSLNIRLNTDVGRRGLHGDRCGCGGWKACGTRTHPRASPMPTLTPASASTTANTNTNNHKHKTHAHTRTHAHRHTRTRTDRNWPAGTETERSCSSSRTRWVGVSELRAAGLGFRASGFGLGVQLVRRSSESFCLKDSRTRQSTCRVAALANNPAIT